MFRDIHQHQTMGELVEHLKLLDKDIYTIVNNNLGINKQQIEMAYSKLKELHAAIDKDKDNEDSARTVLTMQILESILDNYRQVFQDNNKTFHPDDKCTEIIGPNTEKLDNNLADLSLLSGTCPDNHYLKGVRLENSWEYASGGLHKVMSCCPLKRKETKCQKQYGKVNLDINQKELLDIDKVRGGCPDNHYLKNSYYNKYKLLLEDNQEINFICGDNYLYLVADECLGSINNADIWKKCCDASSKDYKLDYNDNCMSSINVIYSNINFVIITGISKIFDGVICSILL